MTYPAKDISETSSFFRIRVIVFGAISAAFLSSTIVTSYLQEPYIICYMIQPSLKTSHNKTIQFVTLQHCNNHIIKSKNSQHIATHMLRIQNIILCNYRAFLPFAISNIDLLILSRHSLFAMHIPP